MVPSEGILKLDDSTEFKYKLADEKDAYVHVGWLTCLAALMPTIKEQIMKCYGEGVKQFIIMGHSQGGAIAFLASPTFIMLQTCRMTLYSKRIAAPRQSPAIFIMHTISIYQPGWMGLSRSKFGGLDAGSPLFCANTFGFQSCKPFCECKSGFEEAKKNTHSMVHHECIQ